MQWNFLTFYLAVKYTSIVYVCSIYLESQEKSGFVGRQVKLFAAHLIAIQGIGGRNGTDLK